MACNKSKQNDLATKFTEWVTNEENAKIRFEKTKEIPPVKSVMEDPIIKDNEAAKAVATQSENGIPMPNIPEMQEVWKPAGDALQLVVTDKEAPKAALDSAVKQIKGNIEANHSKKNREIRASTMRGTNSLPEKGEGTCKHLWNQQTA